MPSSSKNYDFEARLYRAKRNRACDSCRKRKARCDGYEMLDNRCTTCITYGAECTYLESSKKPTSQSYVRELENRLAKVERVIRELSDPESQISLSLRVPRRAKGKQSAVTDPATEQAPSSSSFARVRRVDALGPLPEADECENDDFVTLYDTNKSLADAYKEGDASRFFGEGGAFAFSQNPKNDGPQSENPSGRRPEFWTIPTWMFPILKGPRLSLVFPEPSLMRHLLDTYFEIHNIILPILHRPTFERSLADKLHERNESFGVVVLLMCAIACRHSDDPRITHPITTSTSNTGWNLFNQVDRLRRTRLLGHQLCDAQIYALAACFLDGLAPPQGPWAMVGIGLRVMQDVGVHRRSLTGKQTVENELWKRCFWVLVIMDRSFSNLLGRSCAIQDEDFDVDLPSSCDDEYLEHPDPEKAFKQPPGIPSKMDYFISVIRLSQILAFSQRTLYSTRKSRLILGYVGKRWENHIVSSLETALRKWADSVPQHLRWDAQKDQTNMTWLRQALSLVCGYYELQLIIHRQFIARPDPALSGPALTRSNEAAKNCLVALGSVKDKMNGKIRCHVYVMPLFAATMFLSLQFYKRKNIDRESEEYKAVRTIQEMLLEIGLTWTTAKRLTSVLNVILTLSDRQYKGWQPGKDDLLDIQMGLLYFVDKHGKLSLKEARWSEEEDAGGTNSYGSTSLENTPSPQSVPSVKRSTSGPSSIKHSGASPNSTEEVTPTRSGLNTTAADEVTQLAPSKPEPVPGPSTAMGPLGSGRPSAVQPDLIPGRSGGFGGPPPPDGRFFNSPMNLRTIMTGAGDGYRSPEPPSRLDTVSPLYYVHNERPMLGGGPTISGFNPSEMVAGRLGPSFSVSRSVATQPPNGPGLSVEHGCGVPLPPSPSSSVLPAELMVYNDLMMDIGTAQHLGRETRELGPPPFVHPSTPTNDGRGINDPGRGANGYQWQGVSHHAVHEPPQAMSSFGYHQPGQPYYEVGHTSAQHTNSGGQWPTGGITDYNAWERTLYENFMMDQQANQRFQG